MASPQIDAVAAFTVINASAWPANNDPQYLKMLGVRNAINDIRGLYEDVAVAANAVAAAAGAGPVAPALTQAVTDAFTAFQASQVKLVNLLTGVYPGGSRKKRQSKKKKNSKHNNKNNQ